MVSAILQGGADVRGDRRETDRDYRYVGFLTALNDFVMRH